MKLNNKGITLVELIISFALLMVIVIGMMSIIMDIRDIYSEKKFSKEMSEYKSMMTQLIYKDLIKQEFVSISNCPSNQTNAQTVCAVLNFNNTSPKMLKIVLSDKQNVNNTFSIIYDDIKYPVPNYEELIVLDSRFDESFIGNSVSIILEDDVLKINLPYYEIDDYDKNGDDATDIGIKIIHPIIII